MQEPQRRAKGAHLCATRFHPGWRIRADAFCRDVCACRPDRRNCVSQTCRRTARLRHPWMVFRPCANQRSNAAQANEVEDGGVVSPKGAI
jgi:hypothetical protein